MNKIYIGNGILEQIKHPYYINGTITKKGCFESWMNLFKEFYEKYPYAYKWDYENWGRELFNCYD